MKNDDEYVGTAWEVRAVLSGYTVTERTLSYREDSTARWPHAFSTFDEVVAFLIEQFGLGER